MLAVALAYRGSELGRVPGAAIIGGGPHLILIGLLIAGPCCALLTARWALTAAATSYALSLEIALGVPDQIFATTTQYVLLAAVAITGTAATVGAAPSCKAGSRERHDQPRLA